MTNYVVDASVVLKYFAEEPERHSEQAEELLRAHDAGKVTFAAPPLLELEVLNVLGRQRGLSEAGLDVVTDALADLEIESVPIDAHRTIPWIARGLTAYDATYVLAAVTSNSALLTDDAQIVALAPDVATALADFSG